MPETLVLSTVDGEMPLVHVRAARERGPALVVVPSIFGADEDLVEHAQHFAALGAHVFIVDPWWRTAPGPRSVEGEGAQEAFARMKAADRPAIQSDLRAVLLEVAQRPDVEGRVVVLGICFGGGFAVQAALDGGAQGVAAWHGGGIGRLVALLPNLPCPANLHFGGADGSIPVSEVDAIAGALRGLNADVVLHDGLRHGFTHSRRPEFDAEATAAARAGVARLLEVPR